MVPQELRVRYLGKVGNYLPRQVLEYLPSLAPKPRSDDPPRLKVAQ